METAGIVRFTAANGREVAKVVTPSGVTGYIDTSIPVDALVAIRDTMLKDLGMTLEEYRATYGVNGDGGQA